MAFLGPLAARCGAVTAGPATAVSASGAAPASATAPRRAAAPAASGRSSSSASLGKVGQHGPARAGPARVRVPSPPAPAASPLGAGGALVPAGSRDGVIHGGGRGQQGWGKSTLLRPLECARR